MRAADHLTYSTPAYRDAQARGIILDGAMMAVVLINYRVS